MGLFGTKKAANDGGGEAVRDARVKVLGSGCAKCRALEAAVRDALETLGMEPAIEHVTDFGEIAAYGVMTTPALVVDGRVVSWGKVLKQDEAAALLREQLSGEERG